MLFAGMLPLVSSAQYITSTQTIGSGANQLDIAVTIDVSVGQVKFVMTGPAAVWFGFSFNTTSMTPGSYTILANVSGGNPSEYLMQNHAAPTLQSVQNLTGATSSTAGGRKTFTFYRNISTGDANDYTFQAATGNLNIAWAYGSGLSMGIHNDRGSSSLPFVNPCPSGPANTLPVITICTGDSVVIFGQVKKTSGNFTQTYPIAWGCDSVVAQQLVVVNGISYVKDTTFADLCKGDTLTVMGSSITAPGNYQFFSSKIGCDSTFDLYIVNQVIIDTTIAAIGFSLNAIPGYDQYQWIDCATGLQAPGSINSSIYSPLVSGSYKVIITDNGCTDESGCHPVLGISVSEPVSEIQQKTYPNPANDLITFETSVPVSAVRIHDLTGRTVLTTENLPEGINMISVRDLKAGNYVLEAKTAAGSDRHRIVIAR